MRQREEQGKEKREKRGQRETSELFDVIVTEADPKHRPKTSREEQQKPHYGGYHGDYRRKPPRLQLVWIRP